MGSNAHEDEQRENTCRHSTGIQIAQQSFGTADFGHGYVAQDRAKADRNQKERLKSFSDREIDQHTADGDHENLAEFEMRHSGSSPKF